MVITNLTPASIIIPSYNRARPVTRAIGTVLSWTHRNYEVIAVDDGSVDEWRKVLKDKYSDQFRYAYQSNAGATAACNTGIKLARFELIAFLASDDI